MFYLDHVEQYFDYILYLSLRTISSMADLKHPHKFYVIGLKDFSWSFISYVLLRLHYRLDNVS